MDRFDSMRAKKIVGGGSNLDSLGVSVAVEASNSFKAGDRFVGVPMENVTPSIETINLGIESIADASEDLSVAVPTQTITSSSKTIKVGFLNSDNVYELVDVDLPTAIENIKSSVTLSGGSSLSVNEDGSLIMVNGLNFGDDNELRVLVIKTHKGGGSASFHSLELDSRSGYDNFTGYPLAKPSGFVLTKNYLLIYGGYKWTYTTGTDGAQTTKSGQISTIHYFDGNSFGKSVHASYSGGKNLTWDKTRVAWYNNSTLIAIGNTQGEGAIQKYVLNNRTLESFTHVQIAKNSTAGTFTISRNASYIGWSGNVYALNYDLSYTKVSQVGTSTPLVYPDSTGSYTLVGSNIRKTSALDTVVMSAYSLSSRYFDVSNGYFYRSGVNKVYKIPQGSEEAEYFISSNAGNAETAGRIYGIVPYSMIAGEIGTAQALFET